MASGKLLILAVLAMAMTLGVVTQAQSAELDGLKQACVSIAWDPCVVHLMGMAPVQNCCTILSILHSQECQCFALESILNNMAGLNEEYALNLPKKCGTLEEGCPMIKMPYM